MLYVFHVDIGRMFTFDISVALASVENLKDTIERLHGIPAANIVLLVSGGEMLMVNTPVSVYSAGTDTNPIYMFLTGEIKMPPPLLPADAELDLREQVERSLELPAEYKTVAKRAQIALRMQDLAQDEDRMCERLVHEQHLQQQGWSAVIANMEDLTAECSLRYRHFCTAFDRHLEQRSSYLELLNNFEDDLNILSRIPILPGLMPLAEIDFHGFDDLLENDEVFSGSTNPQQSVVMVGANTANICEAAGDVLEDDKDTFSTSPNKKLKMADDLNEERMLRSSQISTTSNAVRRLNLLQWINSKENSDALRKMSEECKQDLSNFDEEIYNILKETVQFTLESAKKSDIKEIRGLGDRLCQLEEFKYKIKSMVKDQKELSTAFQQNQSRALNLRDTSILPDLCASHQSQLLVMLQNHRKIRDHRHCISKAKDELGANMHARLKRIMYLENLMSEYDNKLLFHHRCIRRVERHIHIIEQIHQAPNMYLGAVTEVMRRQIFSTEYRMWASKLAKDFDAIHSEEMKRRQQFNVNFEGHFLNILFPGMADMPPVYANDNPLVFDTDLPNITRSDIDVLSTLLPEMTSQIQLPDMEPVIYFFVSRSGVDQRGRFQELQKQRDKRAAEELKKMSAENEQIISSSTGTGMTVSGKLPLNPRLSELRKDTSVSGSAGGSEESETDTETEFEQVPPNSQQSVATSTSENLQLVSAITKSTATDELLTQSAETLTDENSETLGNEVTHMRVMLGAMSKLALDCIHLARSNIQTFREESITQREDLQSDLQTLNNKWNVLRMQVEARERELAWQQTRGEEKILQLLEELKQRDCELLNEKEINREMSAMKIKCETLEAQLEDLNNKMKFFDVEKEQAVLEVRDKLMHEHKTEIESLRQRFKLMSSMERSPSDLNLETGYPLSDNVIAKQEHEHLLSQLRMDLEMEKEKAITTAIEMERSIWQSKIFPLNSESVMANVSVLKEMLEDKERQLDQLREKDLVLTKENYQLKTRLDALTNEEGNSWLKEKIDYLCKDKSRLEEELNNEKSKRLEMQSSFAALKCSNFEQSPLPRPKSGGSSHRLLVLESCAKGDLVFVVWNIRYGQFMVVQDSPSLYFVHGDSLPALNLRLPQIGEESTLPMPYYAIARVVDKEYCQAKKDENRYRVQRGSKFYRVKLAPVQFRQSSRRERLESFTLSTSRSISQCEGNSESSQASAANAVTSTAASTSPCRSATTTTIFSSISSLSKDVVDAAVANTILLATSPTTVITTTANQADATPAAMHPVSVKERTVSITSVSEEDDEPLSLLKESCAYSSFSEEDENLLAAGPLPLTTTAVVTETVGTPTQIINLQQTQQQQQKANTVITEQPTATASKLELDLFLASADINTVTAVPTAMAVADITTASSDDTPHIVATSTSSTNLFTQTTNTSAAIFIPSNQELSDKHSPSIPMSVGTSEDSDEYRSLEPKDDTDFPISE